ncbi:MAG: Gfo/Idh/MocA family oxidoreductase [Vitreoscilla sp.]|nr:Gfo/Idh/MocA family oxidoreductase [Vitreoscilla sp.]
MAAEFAWGLIGPGGIAHRFAEAVHRLPGARLHAVLGRDAARAEAFAGTWSRDGVPPVRVASTLDALLDDPAVQAVYIATPHAQHGEFVRACLERGMPVLCEKPLVPTLAQAEPLVALARSGRVFLMEALWTRFLPLYAQVASWLQSGAIGEVRAIQSSFCFASDYDPANRLYNPALAGGALLDIGIYNLAMTRWVLETALGACPEPSSMRADGVLAPTGVDQRVAGTLVFPGGVVSHFVCAFDAVADNSLRVVGERGCIVVPSQFSAATDAVLQRPGEPDVRVHEPLRINGFEGEVEEAVRCVRTGLIESPHMPHAESLSLVRWMDELRGQLGVRYPFE